MKFAWIENNRIRDLCSGNPSELYHPDIAKFYDTEVPDESQNDDGWVDGQLVKPELPSPAEPPTPVEEYPQVSPIQFKLLWTSTERLTLKSIRQTDPVLDDFFDIIEDPCLTHVDLGLSSTQQGIDYCLAKLVEAAVLTATDVPVRREQILSGALQ